MIRTLKSIGIVKDLVFYLKTILYKTIYSQNAIEVLLLKSIFFGIKN